MDAQNFVGQQGSGYVVYVNGQNVGTFSDVGTAQNLFNAMTGGSSTTKDTNQPATVPTTGPGNPSYDATAAAANAANTQTAADTAAALQEKIREFNQQYSLDTGTATGNVNGQQTVAQQGLSGTLNNGSPTLAAKENAAQLIQNATAGFADPFTYIAKDQSLANAGALGAILGNNVQLATGTPLSSLAATPNLTNVQLATDLASAQNGGQMSTQAVNFLSRMLGVPASSLGQNTSANGSGLPTGPATAGAAGGTATPTSTIPGATDITGGSGGVDANGAPLNTRQSTVPLGTPTINPIAQKQLAQLDQQYGVPPLTSQAYFATHGFAPASAQEAQAFSAAGNKGYLTPSGQALGPGDSRELATAQNVVTSSSTGGTILKPGETEAEFVATNGFRPGGTPLDPMATGHNTLTYDQLSPGAKAAMQNLGLDTNGQPLQGAQLQAFQNNVQPGTDLQGHYGVPAGQTTIYGNGATAGAGSATTTTNAMHSGAIGIPLSGDTSSPNSDWISQLINALHQSVPARGENSSLQEFNQLSPTAQGDYTNLEATQANGQTPTDFMAAMKKAAPSGTFSAPAYAKV